MKFTIPASTLNEAATFAAKAIAKHPVQPILGGLHITAATDGIHIAGSSMEETSKTHVDADVFSEGTMVLSAKVLVQVLGKLRNRTCVVEMNASQAHIGAGAANFILNSMPAMEYPALGDLPTVVGTIDGAALEHAVSMVAGAVSLDLALPVLMGINLIFNGDTITLLSTDRYRLAFSSLKWEPSTADMNFTALVKGPWLAGITKGLTGKTELLFDGNRFGLNTGQRSSVANLVEGKDFPKIMTLFPEHSDIEATFDREEFAEAVDRIATVAERNTPIRLNFGDDSVTLDAGTGAESQGEETIHCEITGIPDAPVAFNPGYLGWSISTMMTEKVSMSFQGNMAKPALIKPSVGETKHLIMPIRLSQVA